MWKLCFGAGGGGGQVAVLNYWSINPLALIPHFSTKYFKKFGNCPSLAQIYSISVNTI